MQDTVRPTLKESLMTWGRIACLSFGGPAGQIAVMHRILIDEKRWISESQFLHALNFCMLLPGPEAQQLAIYTGWLLHGTLGGILAGTLFVLPGFVSILLLSIAYVAWQDSLALTGILMGLKPAVMALVLDALFRVARRVLKNRFMLVIAILAFLALFFGHVPFALIILSAAVVGLLGGWVAPQQFLVLSGHGEDRTLADGAPLDPNRNRSIGGWHALRVTFIWLLLWWSPIVLLHQVFGRNSIFFQQAVFFSQTAMVTFGGAYAVLNFVAQQAVERYSWVQPSEMLDGLGMAETTPGPLIMVLQFVGFLGAYRHPDPFSPLGAGIFASIITVWMTFVPCFFWIFLGAPYVERMRKNHYLHGALSTITAAVVGVIANLAIWFSLHTLFARVHEVQAQGFHFSIPAWGTLSLPTLTIFLVAVACMIVWRQGVATTLVICCSLALIWAWMSS